jgi:hypothetical protein
MALSKYLARDKSTIDASIATREAISGPALAPATDALLIYDASEDKTKKSPISDIVAAGGDLGLDAGTEAFFTSLPTGWTRVTATYTDGAYLRIAPPGTGVTYQATSPSPLKVEDILVSTTLTGTVSATSSTPVTTGGTALSANQMPLHKHGSGSRVQSPGATYEGTTPVPSGASFQPVTNSSTYSWWISPAGGNAPGVASPHTHPGGGNHLHPAGTFTGSALDFEVKYVDFALASKDA